MDTDYIENRLWANFFSDLGQHRFSMDVLWYSYSCAIFWGSYGPGCWFWLKLVDPQNRMMYPLVNTHSY